MSVGESLERVGTTRPALTVRLSRELITLLSEQLYTSASKAIEELVVNSYDADAETCWVVVPAASPGTDVASLDVIAVIDDGVGMDEAGLVDLWRVGASTKRDEVTERIRKRRQIGKFGIGKLATYALASRITYITSSGQGTILSVTLSFDAFKAESEGESETPVELNVREVTTEQLLAQTEVVGVCRASNLTPEDFFSGERHWTLALLEEFKPRAAKLSVPRLRWVLSTAMPLGQFTLLLNGDQVESSKLAGITNPVAEFTVAELPKARLDRLEAKTGHAWSVADLSAGAPGLINDLLPSGVSGRAVVSSKTIYGGKSSDLIRSHGFFVHVRERLIAEDDPLFGVQPLSYEVFNRLRVELFVDDLDADLTAPREGAGTGERVAAVQDLLVEVFNEARAKYEEAERQRFKQETKREDERQYVYPRYVERPVADALLRSGSHSEGGEPGPDADDDWFYLRAPESETLGAVVASLYDLDSREPFAFRVEEAGREGRLVQFDPEARAFEINADHELSLAFKDNATSRDLLYDVAVAEALLEVYLRETGLQAHLIGEVLERRDTLLRSLAREQVNSPAAIAALLRDASASDRDLEVACVVASRALGFVAKHIGNADRADGVARFLDYPKGERKITIEAKSSAAVPSLGAIDFAGLQEHMHVEEADGCLLIAPSYPGTTRQDYSQAARRAENTRVSCWTIDQLANVVGALATRDITARDVLEIVLEKFSPAQVSDAVDALLSDPTNAPRELAVALLAALRTIDEIMTDDAVRSLDMLLPEVGRAGFRPRMGEARAALRQLVAASSGALTLVSEDRLVLNTSVEELERRTAAWAANGHSSRRGSTFHSSTDRSRPEV